jgi:hypothetical protein
MRQAWTWDGKKLSKIDHYRSDGTISWTENFTYDNKNRITRVDDYKNNEYIEYKYDGNNLKSVNYYDEGKLCVMGNITYDGKKIKRVDYTLYDDDKSTKSKEHHLRLLPSKYENIINKQAEKSVSAKDYTTTNRSISLELTWDGNNITRSRFVSSSNGTYDSYNWSSSYSIESTYTYDKNKNPMYGLRDMYCMSDDGIDAQLFSENNILSETDVYSSNWTEGSDSGNDSGTDTYNYTYTYDGKYPTEVLYTEPGSTYSYTNYYEYQ